MLKTNIIKATGISAAIVAGSLLAVTAANAQRGGVSEEERQERITELSERFNLDESEVQAYFEEKREERKAEREERRAEFVAGLVESGTLTQEQADELTVLKDSLREDVQALKEADGDKEEIKALMEEMKAEVEAWANEQGIDLDDIRPDKGEKRGQRR